ncbi:MAG: hypothetical protein LBV04_09145 [Deferribacteraceae bacterium]|jgi:Ca2+/Na+ antiporter|nr:hypothetical protein [Deferribacteraceae bacterium]
MSKIFADSMNLHQDQARILFDYYRKAAEKIVGEERELERSIETAKSEIAVAAQEKAKAKLIAGVIPAVGVVLAIIIFFAHLAAGSIAVMVGVVICLAGLGYGFLSIKKADKTTTDNESKIQAFTEAHRDIRRDYSVKKLGLVYVPVATKVPFEGKSFAVDHSGQVQEAAFRMSAVHQPDELLKGLATLEETIAKVPFVESTQDSEDVDTSNYSTSMQRVKLHDYMGNVDRQIRNIHYLLNDSDTVAFSLPVIAPMSDMARFLAEYATDKPDRPVLPVFDINFQDKLASFHSLNDMRKSFEKNTNENQIVYFKKLTNRIAESVQLLGKAKMASSNKVIDYADMILSTVLKASFNQYSPALEAEEIERIRSASFDYQDSIDDYTPFSLKSSSRVKYDLLSAAWIAEDQSRTAMPFGMHQIQEEVLAPVIQSLMAENRVERLKIYNKIKDQKIDYLNQWHRDIEDFYGRNRAEAADLINRMREAYADYVRCLSTYKALQETQDSLKKTQSLDDAEVQQQTQAAEVIAGFELQAQQFRQKQEDFAAFMDRLKESIDEKAAQFGYIPYYEATLRDNEYRDMARSTQDLQALDPRRKKLLALNPYVAKHAKLPPLPNVEQSMYDDFAIDLLQEAQNTDAVKE